MQIKLWKKLFLLTLVLLFLLPGCGQKKEEIVTVYCLKEIDYGTSKQEYMYDATGNVLEYYHYDSGRTVCTYDENNNTLQSDYYLSDTLNESTVYTYDQSSRMLTKSVTDDSGICEYAYTYDTSGNLTSERMTSSDRPYRETVYSYTYNEEGTLIQSVRAYYDGSELTEKYVNFFNSDGNNLLWEYYSDSSDTPSRKTEWVYDRKGHCLSESTYQDGEPLTRKLYTYDRRGNLLEVRDDPELEKEFIYRTEYTYDKKGNQLSEKEYFSFKGNREKLNRHFTYTYDKKSNLLEETQLSPNDGNVLISTAWTYDKAGNMRTKTHMPGNDSVQTSTYDEHGNLICYEWTNSSGNSWKKTYHYITFELPWHLAEKVQLQQKAVFEALEVKWF